jgi:hypothetical protein
MTSYFSKQVAYILFFAMISVQMLCYNYVDYLRMEPRSIHSWRQADCVSFALNFYHDRATFFQPCVSNLGETGDGKIASDFPLIQYLVAQAWKVTGVNIIVFRAIDVLFLVVGLFFCFKLFAYWFKENYTLALLLTGTIYTSTVLSYYGATTLSDIHAFGLSCMGFYFFIIWLDKKQLRDLLITVLSFTFAGLFKMSSGFIYAIAISFFLVRILFNDNDSKEGLWSIKHVALLLIPFATWFAWYYHVYLYNKVHDNDFFLIGILPIWEIPSENLYRISVNFIWETLPAALGMPIIVGVCVLTISVLIVNIKNFFTEKYLRLLLPLASITTYLMLFFEVFEVHDYYLINMVPVFVLLIGLLVKQGLESMPPLQYGNILPLSLFMILIVLTLQTQAITNARIGNFDSSSPSLFISKQQSEYFAWNKWYDHERYEVLESISEKTLNSIGINASTQVMCLGDITINRGLTLIDRVGYSSFDVPKNLEHVYIEDKKRTGLAYLIVIDSQYLLKENLQPFFKYQVYKEKGTTIFKL